MQLGGTIYRVWQKQLGHGGTGVRGICSAQRGSRTRSGHDMGLSGCGRCKSTCKIQKSSWVHHRVFPTRWETVSHRISFPVVFKENSKVGHLYCHSGDSTRIPCWSQLGNSVSTFLLPLPRPINLRELPKRNVKWLVLNSQSAERTGCGASSEERFEFKPWMPSRHTMPSQRMKILHRSLCQAQRWWWFILVLSGGLSLAHMEAPSPSTMPGLGLPCPAGPHPQGQLGFPTKLLHPSPDLPGTHGVHFCSL